MYTGTGLASAISPSPLSSLSSLAQAHYVTEEAERERYRQALERTQRSRQSSQSGSFMEAASSVIKNISRTTCETGTGRHLGGEDEYHSLLLYAISKAACSFKQATIGIVSFCGVEIFALFVVEAGLQIL